MTRSPRPVGYWLLALAFGVFMMAIIGAVTRLTGSGLAMVDWHPVVEMLPPMTQTSWEKAFALYQQSPQYIDVNHGMSLAQYQQIYFWEWFHRLWGMSLGIVLAGGILYFAARGYFTRRLLPGKKWIAIFAGLFLLGLLQGRIGWFMVESGLQARPSVSHYRLAMHLTCALTIYAALIWSGLTLLYPAPLAHAPQLKRHASLALVLVCATMVWGAFVAGLRAGLVYNTFPLMGGGIAPPDLLFEHPLWLNFFANPSAVQFTHRMLAMTSFCVVLALALRARKILPRLSFCLGIAVCAQVGLGISTLILMVPIPLAATHQAGAITVLTVLLAFLFALRSSPAPAASMLRQDNTAHSNSA